MAKKIKWKNIRFKEKGWKTLRNVNRKAKYDIVWQTLLDTANNETKSTTAN